ncbi:unnamed protein product [Urochloa decumbens]|uniref:Uncharacterized protein n=1 Tax=Urochloa decumbens TaxID=240449 RepID=A0ABC9AJP7_9POAL
MAVSANGDMLRMAVPVAACIVLVLLSMGPASVMANNDAQDNNCRPACVRACNDFASQTCKKVTDIAPILKIVPSFLHKCREQASPLCVPTCNNFCMMLTPGAPAPAPARAVPPPCKP